MRNVSDGEVRVWLNNLNKVLVENKINFQC